MIKHVIWAYLHDLGGKGKSDENMVDATHVEQADPTPTTLANSFSMHAKCSRIGSQRFMEAEACFKEQASQHTGTSCHETKIFLVPPSLLADSLKEQLPGLLYDYMKYINSLKDSLPGFLSGSLKLNLSLLLKENVTTIISKKEKKALRSAMTDIMTTSLMPFNKQFNALNKLDAKRKSSFIYSNEENENPTETFDVVVLVSAPSQVEPQPSGSSSNLDSLGLVTVVILVPEEEEPKPKRLMVVMDLPNPVSLNSVGPISFHNMSFD
ncbi:hypothetical protein Tco_1447128 [Tanacetum coccineum]